jgi:hypothetical protein
VKHNLGAFKVRMATFNEKKTLFRRRNQNRKIVFPTRPSVKHFTARRFILDERRPNAPALNR